MEVFDGHASLFRPLASPAVALGNFDGVHVGHQRLLHEAVRAARSTEGDAVAFTFEPHPAQVLAPKLAPRLITNKDRKLELIAEAGIDVCIVEPFDAELASLSPDDFLQRVLVEVVGARHVVVGYDFTYGHKRSGTTGMLHAFGDEHGFTTQVVGQVAVDGLVASSTKVRNFVASGKFDGARLLLGRDFDYDGQVVRGAGRGRTIGIPTANLEVGPLIGPMLLPPRGVYAVRGRVLDGEQPTNWHLGVANLGFNPTFVSDGELGLEVHLFDFEGDLLGRRLRVAFVERLRGERRFSGAESLVAQIRKDMEQARAVLASNEA